LVKEFDRYVSLRRVQDFIEEAARGKARKETIGVRSAYGRVAAEDLNSPSNVPDRPRSHMDGFAVKASDVRGAARRHPKILQLKGGGGLWKQGGRIRPGETMRVATGEYLPRGADSVVPVEDARRVGQKVVFGTERSKGDHCFGTGSDISKGSRVIEIGRTLRAQDIGLMVMLGVRRVKVYSRPKVALIATGNELIPSAEGGRASKVRESHIPIFEHLIWENGGEPVVIGIVPDSVEEISSALEYGLRTSEVVCTLGGTSLGERDMVEQAIQHIEPNSQIFHGIRLDRGRVSGAARVKGKTVLMLPGPVQAAMNAFILLAIPAIRALLGKKKSSNSSVVAKLATDWESRKRFEGFTKVVYVRLADKAEGLEAHPILKDTESMSVLTDSNGYVVVPESTTRIRAGSKVKVNLLPGFSYIGGRFLNEG
jgi:molybdenum cofactor synthesis domain-containing protein